MTIDHETLKELTHKMADEGKLVDAGWLALEHKLSLRDASAAQLDDMHLAYMLGAQHIFASVMDILEPSKDHIDGELKMVRLRLMQMELEKFFETQVPWSTESLDGTQDKP